MSLNRRSDLSRNPLLPTATDAVSLALWVCSIDELQSGTLLSWLWLHESGSLHRIQLRDLSNLEITIGDESARTRRRALIEP